MKTLEQTIAKMERGAAQSLRKHLAAVGINDWTDITRSTLYDLKDHLGETVAASTAKQVLSNLRAVMNRVKDEADFPADFAKILAVKATAPMKTYLTEDELALLENAPTHTAKQLFVKNVFIICAYTGLRVSDAINLTPENIVDGCLHFVAQKTKKAGAIPLKSGLAERIAWVASHPDKKVTLMSYNRAVRKLCKDAGICDEVVVFKAGKEMKGPKWKFVSSHTARISTASCLNRRGVPIGDISKLLQHSGVQMTERYIIRDHIQLSSNAMKFFR